MTSTATRQGSRIIATGCTSGLGLTAIRHILQTSPASLSPPYHVILLGRGKNPTMALDELSAIDTSSLVDFIPCVSAREGMTKEHGPYGSPHTRTQDLTSLTSVKNATEEIRSGMQCEKWRRIAPGRIDVLLLNAGIAKLQRTLVRAPSGEGPTNTPIEALRDQEERYEETALVNHVCEWWCVRLVRVVVMYSPTEHANHRAMNSTTIPRLSPPPLPSITNCTLKSTKNNLHILSTSSKTTQHLRSRLVFQSTLYKHKLVINQILYSF